MRIPISSSSIKHAVAAVGLATAALSSSREARADDKDKAACSAAYQETQALRLEKKLGSARTKALACARDACPDFIRSDCTKWVGEIDASQPTVVFAVRDPGGREATAVRVELDGAAWLDRLDGTSKAIDPGDHTLRFTIEGAPPFGQSIQIREGEKNRLVSVALPAAPPADVAPTPDASKPASTPASTPASKPGRSAAPWIVGGIGAAGLVVFAVAGIVVLHEKSITNTHCPDAKQTCDATGESAASLGRAMGVTSTVGLITGVVGVGTGALLLGLQSRSSSAAASARASRWLSVGAGRLDLGGTF